MSSVINYRINSITSESPNYPASNLINETSSLGWQTEYSPTYPQQLNLQFFTPIRTKQIKLIFHQYKIPTCVEIFVRLTTKQNYRKLGYVIPNDNSQSSHEHKEIKTLYFQFPCNYIKLVFYQNYKNEMNLFEQVALEELVVEGQAMTYNEIRNLDLADDRQTSDDEEESLDVGENKKQQEVKKKPQFPSTGFQQTNSNEQLSKKFNDVYAHLQSQKIEAVQNQDFKLAAHLKNAIQAFKDIQDEMNILENQKRLALQQQDFDKCHRIKQQISKKKQQFQYRVQQLVSNQDNFMAEYSHSRIYRENQLQTQKKTEDIRDYFSSTPERPQPERSISQKNKNLQGKKQQEQQSKKVTAAVDHDEQVLPAVRNKILGIKNTNEIQQYPTNRSNINNTKNLQKSSKSPRNRQRSPPKSPKKKTPHHLQNIKSPIQQYKLNSNKQQQNLQQYKQRFQFYQQIKSSKNFNQNQQVQNQQNNNQQYDLSELHDKFKHFDLQPMDLKLRMKLQSHFQIIDQPYWQMIMHKNWKIKKQALEYVIDNVTIGNKQSYMACIEFVSFSIKDTHTQVLIESLNLLRKIIEQGGQNQIVFTLPHLPFFVQEILTALLNLMTSTNKQLSQESYNLYLLMGMIDFLSIQQLIQKLIKHKQTAKASPQHILMKIGLMISIMEKYTESTKYYKDIVLWAMSFYDDPNNKVRNQASYVVIILSDIVGQDKIKASLKDKPKMLDKYNSITNSSNLIQQSKLQQNSRLIDQSSRITDRNLSKLEQNNASFVANKSSNRSRQKPSGFNKNPGNNISQNLSSLSNRASDDANNKKLKNPWTVSKNQQQRQPISKFNNNKIKIQQQSHVINQDQELQYSKQSGFYGSSIKKSQSPSNVYYQRGYQNQQFSHHQNSYEQGQIKVLDDDQEEGYKQKIENLGYKEQDHENQGYEQEEGNDPGKCDFCFMDLNGLDQREHLMTQCKVIAYCEECMGRIYIRQITQHLLYDCPNKTRHQQCKKCGIVFNIDEINEHVGQGICKIQRGQGWQRCQFCCQDVLANDNKWVQHAYKCPNLPEPTFTQTQNVTQKYSDDGNY